MMKRSIILLLCLGASNVRAQNAIPTADSQSLEMFSAETLQVTLKGVDHDTGQTLSYHIIEQPQYGTLEGTAPNLTYIPDQNFLGLDFLTYKVNDGMADSDIATITIEVKRSQSANSTTTGSSSSCTLRAPGKIPSLLWVLGFLAILFGIRLRLRAVLASRRKTKY
jgi:hypothetical protein